MSQLARTDRRHEVGGKDQRDPFQRDRDRILYSSAFRRLAGITQIVRAGEADVFHTRQQHTLKVAQVGRRLAEKILKDCADDVASVANLHPEVVEAAALAHDLGHPPFGHVGEKTLDRLVFQSGDENGFEGNAQSFRILTKLAVRFPNADGLDLCRATLAACLKYPWLRDRNDSSRKKKWGAYHVDAADFEFARALDADHHVKTVEAQLMDWADDIAYSVHDLEDFHRCGAIPWNRILHGDRTEALIERATTLWFGRPPDAEGRLRRALQRLRSFFYDLRMFDSVLNEIYEGTREQRYQLRLLTSQLVNRYVSATQLTPSDARPGPSEMVVIETWAIDEVKLLKQITQDYVINSPILRAQQEGQIRIIESLFEKISNSSANAPPPWLPRRLEYLWSKDISQPRFAADCIASLTETEVVRLNERLQGWNAGSVLDPIVR